MSTIFIQVLGNMTIGISLICCCHLGISIYSFKRMKKMTLRISLTSILGCTYNSATII